MITKKVLLLNGDTSVREILSMCLSQLGEWHVIEADSPSQGLERAAQDQPDAIILDLESFSMDYGNFLQRLRAQPMTKTIPVVLLTAGTKWLDLKGLQPFQVAGAIDYSSNLVGLSDQIAKLLDWKDQPVE